MINWIDCKDKRPPQNENLLWCRATKNLDGAWDYFGVGVGKYRFGNVDTPAGLIYKLSEQIEFEHRKIFWARFNEPRI